MNLVSLLIAPAIVSLSIGADSSTPLRILVALVAVAIIVGAVYWSKRRSIAVAGETDGAGSTVDHAAQV
jgi:K(+)-stimulated pyrophosphate-energized sodium pump